MASYSQKVVKKSSYWSHHGKHSKVDPFYIRNERKRRPMLTPWYGDIRELFGRR